LAPPPPVPRSLVHEPGFAQSGAYGYGSLPQERSPAGASRRRAHIQEFQFSRSSKQSSTTHFVLALPQRSTIFERMLAVTGLYRADLLKDEQQGLHKESTAGILMNGLVRSRDLKVPAFKLGINPALVRILMIWIRLENERSSASRLSM